MAEHEDFSYQTNNQGSIDYSLITQERTAKLDLLIHLLSNSNRAVVLCGSTGVGKTTLLSVFQQRRTESWQTCLLHGKADLSFEQIEARLIESIPNKQTLADFFDLLAEQHKKIVLIVDDAGVLVPYLINTLIDYAAQQPALKIVFVLTHDELAIKTRSDNTIEDCHIIEIPPLSETQCGDFLQHLALKSTLKIPIHSITDDMIAALYQQTSGIPASIIEQLPMLARPKKHTKTASWFPFILLSLIVAWIVLWFLSGHTMPSLAPLTALLKLLTDR